MAEGAQQYNSCKSGSRGKRKGVIVHGLERKKEAKGKTCLLFNSDVILHLKF